MEAHMICLSLGRKYCGKGRLLVTSAMLSFFEVFSIFNFLWVNIKHRIVWQKNKYLRIISPGSCIISLEYAIGLGNCPGYESGSIQCGFLKGSSFCFEIYVHTINFIFPIQHDLDF